MKNCSFFLVIALCIISCKKNDKDCNCTVCDNGSKYIQTLNDVPGVIKLSPPGSGVGDSIAILNHLFYVQVDAKKALPNLNIDTLADKSPMRIGDSIRIFVLDKDFDSSDIGKATTLSGTLSICKTYATTFDYNVALNQPFSFFTLSN